MRINQEICELDELHSIIILTVGVSCKALSSSKILLVPYKKRHVITYHEWMKSEEIQQTTASERLSLDEEYRMQKSWQTDQDKLTFIICAPIVTSCARMNKVKTGMQDAPDYLLGDVNLFLSASKQNPDDCIGELEIMIAPVEDRGKGYGRAAILVFLYYIQSHLDEILREYKGESKKSELIHLQAKIGCRNTGSIRLFESIGFRKFNENPNYFGEFELIFENVKEISRTRSFLKTYGIEKYIELQYIDEED